MYAYFLSKEHPTMPEWEVKEYFGLTKYIIEDNILFTSRLTKDLALTKRIGKVILKTKKDVFEDEIKKGLKILGSFSVRVPSNSSLEKKFANLIHLVIKNPKVNLTDPTNELEVWFTSKSALLVKIVHKNKDVFSSRASHNRIFPHPSGLSPKIAKALVNMIGKKRKINDPFCGSGGILIEAGLLNRSFEGSDIDPMQIKRAKGNLEQFSLPKNVKLKDALSFKKYSYVVTDLPYGRNTGSNVDVQGLVDNFLKIPFKKAIIGLPEKITAQKKPRATFIIYVHKSMKRKYLLF